jgi:predicted transcriptional regulator
VGNKIVSLTAQIVSAHIVQNDVAAVQLPGLIRGVHNALSTAGQAPVEPIKTAPAVSVPKSVFPEHIVCLGCGKSFQALKKHIRADHDMEPDEYRAKWGLPLSYRMVTQEYAARRSQIAKDSGLGRKIEVPMPKKRGRPKFG